MCIVWYVSYSSIRVLKKGKKWKQWQILFSWAPKSLLMVTTALKLRDTGFLGRKAMTNLDNMLKSRGKGPCSQSYDYYSSHVWIWVLAHKEDRSWVLKNWCLELWCWRRLWRVPWTTRRSNQSILKEINPNYSLEGLMLKLQYLIHLM